jgi:hypothetical protein
MTTYTSPFTGQTINPAQVGYESLSISTNTYLQWPINGNNSSVVANILDVTATANGLQLLLPPALEVSVGQAFIIRNIGNVSAYGFTLANNSGGTIQYIPVAPTTATVNSYYVYLTDNTTINGTWSTIAMGVGTSSASANDLAGYGLLPIANTLNEATTVSQFSSSYTFTSNDRAAMYVWTGGAGTATLPQTSSVGAGYFVIVKNDGSGILNVAAQGTSTIDFTATTVQIQIANSSIFVTDGTNWYTYALAQTNVFNYTQLLINVSTIVSSPYTLTNAQAKNVVQEYTGTLGLNLTIVVPPTVQIYSFRNTTTGSYSLTFSTGVVGGTNLILPQGQAIIAICDGTNLYNANSATSSFIQALTLGNGSASNPSLSFQGDATTGLYLAATGQLGFAIAGQPAGQLTANGLLLPVGIDGGAF